MICKNCGDVLNDDSAFCSKCGCKTDIENANNNNSSYKPTIHRTHKKNDKIIGIIIIIFALGVFGNILFLHGRKENVYEVSYDTACVDYPENNLNIDINQFAGLSFEDIEDIFGEEIESEGSSENYYSVYSDNNNEFLYKFTFKDRKVTEVEISNVPYENDAVIFNSLQIDDTFDQVNDTGYAKKFVANPEKGDNVVKQVLIQGIDKENYRAEKIRISYK